METVTLTYNPNSSFAIALLNLIKASGEVTVVETKPAKTTRKKPTKKERFLTKLTKAGQQAIDIAKKDPEGLTEDELIASIFDD